MNLPLLLILRHGETEWNVKKRVQGRKDSPLTNKGRAQAAAQGRLLQPLMQEHPSAKIICSPLGRTRATATIALRGISKAITLDARLQEVSAGDWEGLLRPDIYDRFKQKLGLNNEFDLFTKAPGGETEEQLRTRCQAFLDDMRGPTVVITHGITSLMLRGLAQGMAYDDMVMQSREQGCIYFVENGVETCLREPEN